jgi:YbbR domain-containing protein
MPTTISPPPAPESRHRVREEVHHLRRWLRRHTSREALLGGLKTFAWVAPLTLLIWIYAEREQETPEPSVPIVITVKSNDPNRVVKNLRENVVTADLRGPRSKLDLVRSELAKNNEDQAVHIDVPNSFPPGVQYIPIALQIQNDPLFVENGIKVDNVRPQTLTVSIDQLETRDVPVDARPSDAAMLSSRPVFTPAMVKIRGPQQVIETAMARGDLKVYADLSAMNVLQQPGTHDNLINIPLVTPVQDENVSLSQTTVKGSIEVKAADAKGTINSLPVWYGGNPQVMKEYDVIYTGSPVITNVNVVGPADKIAELTKPGSPALAEARAWLIITRDDTVNAGTVQAKKLLYVLPKGVSVSPADEARTFEFKLVSKAANGG